LAYDVIMKEKKHVYMAYELCSYGEWVILFIIIIIILDLKLHV
jgi:hypothetical protein